MNSLAKGVTDPANNPNGLPNLEYNGNQQDDSQDFVVNDPASDHFHVEWNLKIIAKGNDGSIFDQDDFFLHIVADTPVDITSAVLSGTNYCR
jgi:hypothetical protein